MYFSMCDGEIVFGLMGIKGMGEGAAEAIVTEREKNGPYKDFMDLADRVNPRTSTRRCWKCWIKTGPSDKLGTNRGNLLANLEEATSYVEAMGKHQVRPGESL